MTGSPSYLLDTNTVSYIVNGRSQLARKTFEKKQEDDRVAVSTITQAELLFGIESKPAATKLRRAAEAFLTLVEVLAWDTDAAKAYARLRTQINQAGQSLSSLDMLIAAHALALGAILVTHDRAFTHVVPLLQISDWATDL